MTRKATTSRSTTGTSPCTQQNLYNAVQNTTNGQVSVETGGIAAQSSLQNTREWTSTLLLLLLFFFFTFYFRFFPCTYFSPRPVIFLKNWLKQYENVNTKLRHQVLFKWSSEDTKAYSERQCLATHWRTTYTMHWWHGGRDLELSMFYSKLGSSAYKIALFFKTLPGQ